MFPSKLNIEECEKQIELLTDAYRSNLPIQFYGQTVHVVGYKTWEAFNRLHFCFELSNRSKIIINQ
jgi:hypothetical protein